MSAWCQLGTDASDCLYLALNGRMLRARYTSPAFRRLLPVRSHRVSAADSMLLDVQVAVRSCVPDQVDKSCRLVDEV